MGVVAEIPSPVIPRGGAGLRRGAYQPPLFMGFSRQDQATSQGASDKSGTLWIWEGPFVTQLGLVPKQCGQGGYMRLERGQTQCG